MKNLTFLATICLSLLLTGRAHAGLAAAQVPDIGVRVQVLEVDGVAPTPEQKFELTLMMPGQPPSAKWSGGEWSEWVNSTRAGLEAVANDYPNANNGYPQLRVQCSFVPQPAPDAAKFPRVRVQVETRLKDGETSSSEAVMFGPVVNILVWLDAAKALHIDTAAGFGRRVYEPEMKAAFLPENERPKKIVFGDNYIGADYDANNWREGIERLAKLGINAVNLDGNVETMPARKRVAHEAGVNRIWGATYSVPSYEYVFSPDRAKVIKEFVDKQVAPYVKGGVPPHDMAFWVSADEPGWYYPMFYERPNVDPNAMTEFHKYLQDNGQTLESLGKKSWDEVKLIGHAQYSDLPSRRLFYWSNRFINWAFTRYFGEVTKAYEDALYPKVPVMANLNNFIGRFYTPGSAGDGNPVPNDPNAALGTFDWMEFGRQRAVNTLATEDWFGDAGAFQWSYYASKLRSAAALSNSGFSGLVIPRVGGDKPGGMTQKIMELVGNGAKTVQFFVFGPEYIFPANCYSENPAVFKPMSEGMSLVAKGEDLLYPGKTKTPEVAILTPQSSQLWDWDGKDKPGLLDATNTNLYRTHMAYMSEIPALYLTLLHSAIPAQFVDEKGLTEASMKNVKVLYLTAPDLPAESTKAVLQWVRAGGTLITVAGAGQFDRYHQPQSTLLEASGYSAAPVRMTTSVSWKASGAVKSGALELTTFNDRESLKITDAKVLAAFEDGGPALVQKDLGAGHILHYAVYPSLNYLMTFGDTNGVGGGWRELITQPVLAAKVNLPVTVNVSKVEAPALYSDLGVAVTLLNWNAEEKQVEVSVAVGKKVTRVESALHGKINFQQANGRITAQLTLDKADVLKVYYPKP